VSRATFKDRDSVLRILLAGLGVRGRDWLEAIEENDGFTLVGVADPAPTGPTNAPVFDNIDEALRLEPDVLIVATPPESHFEIVRRALELGIPVLCEKPLSEDLSEAFQMASISRHEGVPLLVGMNFRFVPSVVELRRVVMERHLGKPMFSQFTYIRNRDGRRVDLNDYPLTMADPMLMEQSIHHLDLIRHVFQREAVEVWGHTWNPSSSVYRDDAAVTATIVLEDDLVVTYLGTWVSGSNGFDYRWRTDFESGVTVQPGQFGDLLVSQLDAGRAMTGPLYDTEGEVLTGLGVGPTNPFVTDTRNLLQHFLDVVRGVKEPGPSAEDHLATLRLLEAIRTSSDEGRVVKMVDEGKLGGGPASVDRNNRPG
jgi:predicted dehydrogenase